MHSLHRARRFLGALLELNRGALLEWKEWRNFKRVLPDYWEGLPELVFQNHEPVFVLSTGRCGTALLTRVFQRIPGVLCYHTPSPEFIYSQRKAYEEGLEKFEAFKVAVIAARFELLADCAVRGRRYVETNCRITFFAPHLYELFPRARFVHLVRHPGDFVRSGVRRNYYEGRYADVGRIRPMSGPAREAWSEMTIFERCAWLWNETNAYIERFKERRDPERISTLKAEDLFSDPAAALRICEQCRLPKPKESQIARWIRKPVNAQLDDGGLPPYRLWDEARKREVRRWAGLADRYGYQL